MARAERLTAQDWLDAAYARFRTEGLSGVRVEAVARDLGATKGSFYWHFADRAALVGAVMARWEAEETDRFIEEADVEAEPRARLETLFGSVSRRRAPGEDRLYIAAVAEGVGDVVERVTRRRVDYVATALRELGVAPDEAHRRAVAGVAVVLGIEQLGRGGAASVFGGREELQRIVLAVIFD
jgi:AcrR family transcriptional regulator